MVLLGLVVAAILVAAMVAILSPSQQLCSTVGCSDGLTINLEGFRPEPYTLEVSTPDGQTQVFHCNATEGEPIGDPACTLDGVRLNGFTAEEITVTVTWTGGSKTETFRPEYQIFLPNGTCGSGCNIGTVTMRLP